MSPELSQPSPSGARFNGKPAPANPSYNGMLNQILAAWNQLDLATATREVLPCCGSHAWAHALAEGRPFDSVGALQKAADDIWRRLTPVDWDEAFACHPRIGAASTAASQSAAWSSEEQKAVAKGGTDVLERLAGDNARYEQRFGRTYIVCASGKSAEQMLSILQDRLQNSAEQELLEAVEQQRQITQIRLGKWLQL